MYIDQITKKTNQEKGLKKCCIIIFTVTKRLFLVQKRLVKKKAVRWLTDGFWKNCYLFNS